MMYYLLLGTDKITFIGPGNHNTGVSQLINIPQETPLSSSCQAPSRYPLAIEGSVGTTIDGKIVLCGGRLSQDDIISEAGNKEKHTTNKRKDEEKLDLTNKRLKGLTVKHTKKKKKDGIKKKRSKQSKKKKMGSMKHIKIFLAIKGNTIPSLT